MIHSALRKCLLGLVAVGATVATVPAPALAAEVYAGVNGFDNRWHVDVRDSWPGEANDLRVETYPGYMLITDYRSPLRRSGDSLTNRSCSWVSSITVKCLIDETRGEPYVKVDAGYMADRVVVNIAQREVAPYVEGGSGNDFVDVLGSRRPRDIGGIFGGEGDDVLYGWQFGDRIEGGAGNDIIGTGDDVDHVTGGPGADRIDSGAGDDFVYAEDGDRDAVYCGAGWDYVRTDPGYPFPAVRDDITACERVDSPQPVVSG